MCPLLLTWSARGGLEAEHGYPVGFSLLRTHLNYVLLHTEACNLILEIQSGCSHPSLPLARGGLSLLHKLLQKKGAGWEQIHTEELEAVSLALFGLAKQHFQSQAKGNENFQPT